MSYEETSNRKYFWLKQPVNFFDNPKLKKLRKIAGGDVYTIIYQKVMLLSVPHDGLIEMMGLEDDLASELALIMSEDKINVQVTLDFMAKFDLIEELNEKTFLVTDVPSLVGKEGSSAERVRKHRERKALPCKQNLLHSNKMVTKCNKTVAKCNTEVEEELNKELKLKLEIKDIKQPSLLEVEKCITEHNYQIDAFTFISYYKNTNWHTAKGKPVQNWKLTLRNWHLREIKSFTDKQKPMGIVGLA